MAKAKGKTKKTSKAERATRASRARKTPLDPARERQKLTVMVASTIVVLALLSVFAIHHFLPRQAAQRAEAAVLKAEEKILKTFEERADSQGIRILGWQTQVFPRVTLVTYVYMVPGSPDRKAFWWAFDPKTEEVNRVRSVKEFVDEYLLPTVDQLHMDMTGVPGPLALERHVEKT